MSKTIKCPKCKRNLDFVLVNMMERRVGILRNDKPKPKTNDMDHIKTIKGERVYTCPECHEVLSDNSGATYWDEFVEECKSKILTGLNRM